MTTQNMKFDFSEFHDLMHSVFDAKCARMYGGRKHHIKLWWDYKFEYKPYQIVGKIKCHFGKHTRRGYWRGQPFNPSAPFTGYSCEFCGEHLD